MKRKENTCTERKCKLRQANQQRKYEKYVFSLYRDSGVSHWYAFSSHYFYLFLLSPFIPFYPFLQNRIPADVHGLADLPVFPFLFYSLSLSRPCALSRGMHYFSGCQSKNQKQLSRAYVPWLNEKSLWCCIEDHRSIAHVHLGDYLCLLFLRWWFISLGLESPTYRPFSLGVA